MRWIFYNLLFASSCGYALKSGGREERIVATILIVGRFLTIVTRVPGAGRYQHFQPGIFVVDTVALIAIFATATFTKRWWPLWMTALQGAAVASHVMRLSPVVNGFAYYAGIALWIYPMLVLLAIATWRRRYLMESTTSSTSSTR